MKAVWKHFDITFRKRHEECERKLAAQPIPRDIEEKLLDQDK